MAARLAFILTLASDAEAWSKVARLCLVSTSDSMPELIDLFTASTVLHS